MASSAGTPYNPAIQVASWVGERPSACPAASGMASTVTIRMMVAREIPTKGNEGLEAGGDDMSRRPYRLRRDRTVGSRFFSKVGQAGFESTTS
ncbi:hypothetical protein BH23ACT5_BH23ACT5_11070 [soil metagenome]